MIVNAEHAIIEDFLDEIAELFDKGKPVSPDTLLLDADGYAITASQFLRRIRLHESLKALNA